MLHRSKYFLRKREDAKSTDNNYLSANTCLGFGAGVIFGIIVCSVVFSLMNNGSNLKLIKSSTSNADKISKNVELIKTEPSVSEPQKDTSLNEEIIYPLLKQYIVERLSVENDFVRTAQRWEPGGFVWAVTNDKLYTTFIEQEARTMLLTAAGQGFTRSVDVISMSHQTATNGTDVEWHAVVKMHDRIEKTNFVQDSLWDIVVIMSELTGSALQNRFIGDIGNEFKKHNPHGLVVTQFHLTPLSYK